MNSYSKAKGTEIEKTIKGQMQAELSGAGMYFAIGFCGYRNGKNIDKFTECNLTPVNGIEVYSPAIKEIPLTLECKVIYKQEQEHNNVPQDLYEKFYKNVPSSDGTRTNDDYHTVYYGEIVNAYIVE